METAPRPPLATRLSAMLNNRTRLVMAGFGFSSGLPFALIIGTVNIWLSERGIDNKRIGVFAWVGLAYSFKFLWAPLIDRVRMPVLERLGRRRGWILLCQLTLAACFAGLALTDPGTAIGRFAVIAFVGALASATQDIAVDAWRIDNGDAANPIETLSAIYQFGFRTASIVGGAASLWIVSRFGWPVMLLVMATLMALAMVATLAARDTPRPLGRDFHGLIGAVGELVPRTRAVLIFVVLASWVWALGWVGGFMAAVLAPPPGARPPSVADFTRNAGPWILALTVAVPLVIAALANAMKAREAGVLAQAEPPPSALRAAANHVWSALIAPLAELTGRLGWGVLSLLGFILTYALVYNIWASFAGPFYVTGMHYTKDEVAFASKVFGIFMTMAGISLCGLSFAKLGRMPTVLLGALLPPLGNLLYADLASGGAGLDAFAHLLRLDVLAQDFGSSERMVRLLLAICFENISVGMALTAFVAYLSGQVDRRYNVTQYALLSALTSLIGTLGKGAVGAAFDALGYAPVFRWTALAGLVSVSFVLIEWWRTARLSPESRR